jgi:hypothetical protein
MSTSSGSTQNPNNDAGSGVSDGVALTDLSQNQPDESSDSRPAGVTFLPSRPVRLKRKLKQAFWVDNFHELLAPTTAGHTHQCMLCAWTVKLARNNSGSYINSRAVAHLEKKHHIGKDAAVKKKQKKVKQNS